MILCLIMRLLSNSCSKLFPIPDAKEFRAIAIAGVRAISHAILFVRVFLFAAAVPCLMRLKLTRLTAFLEPGTSPGTVDAEHLQRLTAYLGRAIARGSPVVRPGCLTLGLTRYYFFRRAGLDVSLHFGMGSIGEQREFVGHCWLVKDGSPYLEPQDPRTLYTEVYSVSRKRSQLPNQNEVIVTGPLANV
jgi:Transglutaminase-like superfamily